MRLVFALVAVVALVVGCTPEAVESPTPTPSPVETTVTPSESPTVEPPSPSPSPSPTVFQSYPVDLPTEDPETAAIIEGWQEYHRVLRKFSADPRGFTDFSETQLVTTGQKSTGILDQIEGYRNEGVKVLGDFRYDQLEVQEPVQGPDGLMSAQLSYCVDRSGMRVVDYEGVEMPMDHLSPTYPETALLIQGLDAVWRVAEVRNDQGQTC